MKNKKTLLILMIFTMTFFLMACGDSKSSNKDEENQKKEEITFVLDWTPNTNHTGLYVAKELGYFAELGLDVKIVQPPEDGAEALVASGKADFGVSFQDTMASALTGDAKMPIKAVATILQHNTSGIMGRSNEGLNTPKGLEGKKYATWDMPIEKATLKEVVEKNGGDFSKVKMIPSTVSDEISALKSKEVDALWVFYGWAGIKAEVEKYPIDYFNFADIDPVFDFYTPVIISNDKFLKNNPKTAKKFLKALNKGYSYAIENPSKAANILVKSADGLDKELVEKSQEWISTKYIDDCDSWGKIDKTRWDRYFKWLYDNKLIEENFESGFGFTNEYLPK